jgi:hypothetical protein
VIELDGADILLAEARDRRDALEVENEGLRRIVAELSAALGMTPGLASAYAVGAARHDDCSAALHARDLQRKLAGIVHITHQTNNLNAGLVAVAFADIRVIAGAGHAD